MYKVSTLFGEVSGKRKSNFDTIDSRRYLREFVMIIRIQYQGIDGSPWMEEYMEGKLARLERYLSPDALIVVDLGDNTTELYIQNLSHEYEFSDEGGDLFEAFSTVLEDALRILRTEHQRIINKIHRSGPKDQIIEL